MEEDGELPKTLVKLRRTPCDTPRPASTPPVIAASAIQDEDDEEKIIAELEVDHCWFISNTEVYITGFSVIITCFCHTEDISENSC